MLGQLHSKVAISRTILAACALGALLGCSSSSPDVTGEQKQGQESQKDMKKPMSYYEATLDPSQYEDDVEVVEKKKIEEKDTTELRIPKDSTVVQETSQLGFRIQIFSTSNIDEAMNMRTNVLTKLPQDSVYIVYDPPVYKIRLGDFQTRYDASIELPTIVNMGYSDAWIVPDNIVHRKVIQVPRQSGQQ